MIGNDIIDLALAKKESNWKREGFLNKIFTAEEQLLIFQSSSPENMVWNLWSRKEAAYKIYNRQTQNRNYNPMQLICSDVYSEVGKVIYKGNIYFVKTEITNEYIHTIAVTNIQDFKNLRLVDSSVKIHKKDGIPEIVIENNPEPKPISISHHGRFERKVMIS